MKSVCLDTRVLSFYLKGKKKAQEIILNYQKKGYEIYTTTVNISEFVMGLYKTNFVSDEKIKQLKLFFTSLHPRSIDLETALLAGKLYSTILKGQTIGWRDTFIAASVKLNGKIIITGNSNHFQRIPDLEVVKID